MNAHRLYEAVASVPEEIKGILIGAYCYGDDGEPATVTAVYLDGEYAYVDIRQDNGVTYHRLDLDTFLDAIELDTEEYNTVHQFLNDLPDYEAVHENFEPMKTKSKTTKRKLILEDDVIGSGKFNTHKDWHHKRV